MFMMICWKQIHALTHQAYNLSEVGIALDRVPICLSIQDILTLEVFEHRPQIIEHLQQRYPFKRKGNLILTESFPLIHFCRLIGVALSLSYLQTLFLVYPNQVKYQNIVTAIGKKMATIIRKNDVKDSKVIVDLQYGFIAHVYWTSSEDVQMEFDAALIPLLEHLLQCNYGCDN